MRRALAGVAVAVALSGCTAALDLSGLEWSKPGVDISQVTTDEIECVRAVAEFGQTVESYIGGVADAVRFGLREKRRAEGYADCMTSRGYTKVAQRS